MVTIKEFYKQNKRYIFASFFIPLLLMAFVYLTLGIFPGSSRSVLASDAFSQFSNFHASFRNVLLGKQSIFYSWNASLGLNYLSLISYYLGGFFTPLVLLFPNQWMPDALYFLTLLKIGSAGLAFWFYAKHTFKIQPWHQVTLAVCYALMSFITAHSELVMWLDAFVYLPLIIWGIDRLLQNKKPKLLFISYFMLFFSSFYMGFMIGIFSFLYFLSQLFSHWSKYKTRVIPYGITSLLAGGASMIIILPAILDLRTNGEELTAITSFKTAATSGFDFFIKNMIGVYDTTKYGSIPFIYIGLLPLAFATLYFVSNIPWKQKFFNACLFAILMASFYIVPLNLFWHGMHAPNMFLFRYAYLLSFLLLMLAGYGWEQFKPKDHGKMIAILLIWIAIFSVVYGFLPKEKYEYVTILSFVLTVVFLVVYTLIIGFYQSGRFTKKHFALFMVLFVSLEMTLNTNGMLRGILADWNYASRSLYTQPYKDIHTLIEQAKADNEAFYRLENLDPVSSNDSINYGYSGVGMFSSIRNRHSSSYLDQLGFRSRGTNLNIRYPNNTLLMDGFVGIKYNIAKQAIHKYGFEPLATSGDYLLYENKNALPLGFLADASIQDITQFENDNLSSQTNLMNGLSGQNETFYHFHPLTVIKTENTNMTQQGNHTKFTEQTSNVAKNVTWEVQVPAHSQAYLSLYPTNFAQLESSTATITVNGEQRKTQININGQYYDLGYYDTPTTVQVTASFYGTKEVSFQNPQVVTLDTQAYQRTIDSIKSKSVSLTTGKRSASGQVTTETSQQLITTIPYDKGWSATIDGKKVPITAFQDAFVSLTIPKGTHDIQLSYLPQGFLIGLTLFVLCMILFILFTRYYEKRMD
ncbi:YfhO family protein [Candidatus Enterococcus willemsii]|uniref:Copper ABC transporter permease n=1 Tax=Candidatus Enterococcus willemsii TaxID=1857215 RepID=A0ABQ6Z1B2_9ENTE|nr:YfhO family protein [Enterococcus sp. CU12B]KAF1304410.1 copper ABC transporter permease [Enterococcus sp. CU12B]